MLQRSFASRRVLVVADYDSFLKAALAFADPLREQGAIIEVRLASALPGQLSADQMAKLGVRETPVRRTTKLIAKEAVEAGFDAVIVCLNGGRTRQFFHLFNTFAEANQNRRPVTVTGYPGVVFRYHLTGFMDRSPADVFCLTSAADLGLYQSGCSALGVDPGNSVVTGLSLTWDRAPPALSPSRDAIIYFDQPTIPSTYSQRCFLVSQLVALARRSPDRRVIVKPRHRPNETSIHLMSYHLEDLIRQEKNLPANFSVEYGSTASFLAGACLALTFSSTAAIEAMVAGVPTRILTDLGIGEDTGVHFFSGSGCFARLAEVSGDMPDVVNPEWLRAVTGPENGRDIFLASLGSALQARDAAGGVLAPRPLFPANGSKEWFDFANERFGPATALKPSKGYPAQFVRFHSRLAIRYALRSIFSR